MLYQTENLIIRKLIKTDINDLIEMHSDEIMYEFELAHPMEEHEVRDYLQESMLTYQYEDSVNYQFGIIKKDIEKLVGVTTIQFNDINKLVCQIGCWLNTKFANKGITTESCEGMIKYLFDNGVEKICASTFHKNVKAWKVLEKIGMKKEGHIKMGVHIKGEYHDEVHYAIFKSEV